MENLKWGCKIIKQKVSGNSSQNPDSLKKGMSSKKARIFIWKKAFFSFLMAVSCFYTLMFFHNFFLKSIVNSGVLAAFGASSVLSFSNLETKTFKGFHVVLGSLIGGGIGILIKLFEFEFQTAVLLAIGISVFVMNYSKIAYPPGGALALIPLLSDDDVGGIFLLCPVLSGIVIIYIFTKIQESINLKINKKWQLKRQ